MYATIATALTKREKEHGPNLDNLDTEHSMICGR